MIKESEFIPQETQDGSYTFFSEEFQETFHSSFGARQEAEVRYVQPCQIRELAAEQSPIRLLDVCYGLGYNSAAALDAIWQVNPQCHVELIALEISAEVPRQAIAHNLLSHWRSPVPNLLAELSSKSLVTRKNFRGQLLLGDARQTIQSVIDLNWQADAVFLDPFSPPKCPQLWTVEFIRLIAQCVVPQGRLATYSSSAAVRAALLETGFYLGSIIGAGRKSPGTIASLEYKKLPFLSVQEQEHLKTRAAIPYRDRTLTSTSSEIMLNRSQEQKTSNLESTSQWRKRWLKPLI
ncbi:MAG: MnmC family methyltransferase [Cyanobacteria bacterium J06621_8]